MFSKSAMDLLEEKFAMVYDYNHASPLFVRAASRELAKNNIHNALDIINQGIKNFPKYSTAYILLGKVHLELGNFDLAENAFRKGCELTGSENSLSYYLSDLESAKTRHPNITESRRISFFEGSLPESLQLNGYPHEAETTAPKSLEPNPQASASGDASIDDRLEDVAKEISSAKITFSGQDNLLPQGEDQTKQDNTPIISETLAKIYISQGKFKEAIEVYKKLQIKSPDKKGFYQMKIDEIQKQLGDLDWL